MDDMDTNGRLAAHSLLIGFALALATREDANPADAVAEVVGSMRGVAEAAQRTSARGVPDGEAEKFVSAFNSELDAIRSMAADMLASMGTE